MPKLRHEPPETYAKAFGRERPPTFLEFVIEKLIGPPEKRTGGRSYWPCPCCDSSDAFSTMPHDPKYKNRFICFACHSRGDEHDFLKLLPDQFSEYAPFSDFGIRKTQLETWKAEFDGLYPAARTATPADVPSSPSGGTEGRHIVDEVYAEMCRRHPRMTDAMRALLLMDLVDYHNRR